MSADARRRLGRASAFRRDRGPDSAPLLNTDLTDKHGFRTRLWSGPSMSSGGTAMLDVEQAIREVGSIYQALTGRAIEDGRSELPPEIEPRVHLENRYRQLKSILATPQQGVAARPPSDLPWSPPLEVVERENEVRFELDLPGVARDQVSVSVLGSFLVVRGQRGGVPTPGASVRYSERGGGSFQRLIPLPARARRDGVQAALESGVLAIGVPTDGPGEAAPPQQIEVK